MAIEFIRQERAKPWLLNINVYDPHPPFIPPRSYADLFDPAEMPGPYVQASDLKQQQKLANVDFQNDPDAPDGKTAQARYYAMIAQVDDQLARILATLEATGQRENTVILFTSDHGESLGDHGLMYKGCRFYEGLVRVPLIFSSPSRFQQNLQANGLVELLDMSATLLDLCDVEQPDYFQGRSLLPVLCGDESGERIRDYARSEYFDSLDSHFTGGSGTFATMHRTDRHKLVVYHDHNLGELYDLQDDPWEFNDLWDSARHQDLKHELILQSFNAHVTLTTDVGSERIAPM